MICSLLLKKTHFIWKNTVKINTMTTRTTNGCGYTSHVVTVDLVPARANPPGGANMLLLERNMAGMESVWENCFWRGGWFVFHLDARNLPSSFFGRVPFRGQVWPRIHKITESFDLNWNADWVRVLFLKTLSNAVVKIIQDLCVWHLGRIKVVLRTWNCREILLLKEMVHYFQGRIFFREFGITTISQKFHIYHRSTFSTVCTCKWLVLCIYSRQWV